MNKISTFLSTLHLWYKKNKRSLPFRGSKDAYKIWVSEILLQQTQMSRGIEFYNRFIQQFPTIQSLAQTTWNKFLPYFEGLGYYNRGRNMLKAAKVIVEQYKGQFPKTEKKLLSIPGIGPYTAKAILSFAYNKPVLPLDTNIKRILGRVFLGTNTLKIPPSRHPELGLRSKRLKDKASGLSFHRTPEEKLLTQITKQYTKYSASDSNQAMMDFGSSICLMKKPKCLKCPLFTMCIYGPKEKPYEVVVTKNKRVKYEKKYVEAEIYENKKLIKYKGKLLGGYLVRGDERAFLKKLALQKMGIKISVRPAYRTCIKKGVKYSVHRCYVLSKTEE